MPSPHRRRPRFAAGCALVAIATALTGPAWADPAPSYDALLARLGETPATLEADALLDAAEARVRQARVRSNPELGLEAENAFGTGPFEGYGNAETTLSLSQDLELWGRRGARVEVARAEAGTAALRRDLASVEAAGRLALVYAEAEAAERRFALADEALTVTIADTRAALTLVEEGREPLLRGIQGESEAAAARAALDEAQAERDAAFARLTAVAMLTAPVTSIEASLIDRQPAGAVAVAGSTPEVRVAEAEREAAERRIEAERVRSRPDVPRSACVAMRPKTPPPSPSASACPCRCSTRTAATSTRRAPSSARRTPGFWARDRRRRPTARPPRPVFALRSAGSARPTPASRPPRRLTDCPGSASRPAASRNWSCARHAPR